MIKRYGILAFVAAALMLMTASGSAFAVQYTVAGYVFNASGIAVSSASVTLTMYMSGGSATTYATTDAYGYFSAGWTSTTNPVGRTMRLYASKSLAAGSKSWTCASTYETKNVTIKINRNTLKTPESFYYCFY